MLFVDDDDDDEGLRWVSGVSEKKKREVVEIGAVARHVMKCNRGEQCPIMICRELKGEDAMKERMIQAFNTSSPFGMHYAKCREGLGGQVSSVCVCSNIRANMKWFKEEFFKESPMSLQLLAACAVSKDDQMMDSHPYREELLRLKYSAARIQRRWRKFLHPRDEMARAIAELDKLGGLLHQLHRYIQEY